MLNLCRVKYMYLSLGLISIGKDKTSATILDVAASICVATWCFNLGLRYISLKPLYLAPIRSLIIDCPRR